MTLQHDLERRTRAYWADFNFNNLPKCLEKYQGELLADDIAFARSEGRISDHPCKKLVLMVGHSIEPLLQCISVYSPRSVLLLLNPTYGGPLTGENLYKIIAACIRRMPNIKELQSRFLPDEPGPADVFRVLAQEIKDNEEVLLDITGAKKNMTAGAYLFAAFANVPVSYVDFDENAYDPQSRRPYGHGCRIGLLDNPYDKFALRDWERLRTLYNRYKFREARLLLCGKADADEADKVLAAAMKMYLPESQPALDTLTRVLKCYELWDGGDFHGAEEICNSISKFAAPIAVKELGPEWVYMEDREFKNTINQFYADETRIKIYVFDELSRIQRLINFNADFLSAFLRAGALNETIMIHRIVREILDEQKKKNMVDSLLNHTPNAKHVFSSLVKTKGSVITVGKGKKDISFKDAPDISFVLSTTMNDWWKGNPLFGNAWKGKQGWENFLDYRNTLTHQYYSPPHEYAQAAVDFVSANAEDLWSDGFNTVKTKHLPWKEICTICGLDTYLPANLVK